MDCMMPEMDGYACTRGLRERETATGGLRELLWKWSAGRAQAT